MNITITPTDMARLGKLEKLARETRVSIEALRGYMSSLLYSDDSAETIDSKRLVDAASSLNALVNIYRDCLAELDDLKGHRDGR